MAAQPPLTVYDKQLLWNQAKQRRNEQNAIRTEAEQVNECTFEPVLMSRQSSRSLRTTQASPDSRPPRSAGPYSENKARSASKNKIFTEHVARQERARQRREEVQNPPTVRRSGGDARPANGPGSQRQLAAAGPVAAGAADYSPDRATLQELRGEGPPTPMQSEPANGAGVAPLPEPDPAEMDAQPDAQRAHGGQAPLSALWRGANGQATESDGEGSEDPEEALFEQLNRERREWQKERMKLCHVIQLQQQELDKRGTHVEERAAEIANTFCTATATFEERLIRLESNVQAELKSLRLELNQALQNSVTGIPEVNSRLHQLEETSEAVLCKLSQIEVAVRDADQHSAN